MKKLLISAPSGDQQVITVGVGGGYFDPARVLWDESIDGPMPDVTPGGLVRSGDTLVVDAALAAQHAQKQSDRAANAVLLAAIAAAEEPTGFTRRQREFLIANSAAGPLKTALTAIDDLIAAKRAALKP